MRDQSLDVRLISGDYKLDSDDSITVELYGHTKDGKSVVVRDKIDKDIAKRPYCYIVEPDKKTLEYLETRREILKVEKTELYHRGKNRLCYKITTKVPRHVKKLREDTSIRAEFLAADIPFHLRYIYDNDLGACIKVSGNRIAKKDYSADIILDSPKYEPAQPFNPKMRILSFDIENELPVGSKETDNDEETENDRFYNNKILTLCCAYQENDKIIDSGRFSGDEKKIIEDFSNFIRQHDPDVISGYNIEGYDLRVLAMRANGLGIGLPWGRDGSNLEGHKDPKYNKINWGVNGRLIVDTWWAVKMELKPKQESLGAVSQSLLGMNKLDVDPRKMNEEWKNNPDKVIEYCYRDAELSLLILNRLERIRKLMDLGTVSKMPLAEVNKNRSSLLIDSILIREADRSNAGVPLSGAFKEDEEAIEGAYVHELNPGLYHWVCVLDFKSMYPSVIISKNICFTTLSDDGTIISPIEGVKFLDKNIKRGILPKILENLMLEREETKKKMKEAKTKEEQQYYDGLQNAIKIYMNSFYGVFASSFYRFTDKHIGASVTGFSRERTKSIISDIETHGNKVLYSDTDSIFVKSPIENLDGSIEFGKNLAMLYSTEGGQLEFEKIFESMFSHGKKKRYVGKTAWPKKDIVIRGYEIRRTDSFDIQSDTMMEVFNKILENNIDGAIKTAKDTVQDLLKGKAEVDKLVISKGCRAFSAYAKPDTQATVQTAKKMQALGYEFIPGMKVSWIVTNAKETPQEVTPYIQGRKFEATPDWKYYAERMAQTLSRITEVYGITAKDLMAGNIQSSLTDDFEEGAKKKYTITDYM